VFNIETLPIPVNSGQPCVGWIPHRVAVRAGSLTPVLDPGTGKQRRTASGRPIWAGTRIRTRIFRQTYCAARLQTLDRGQPVSLYTVSRELGHESEDMVRRVYARLGKVRHRVEAPEFRPEQWFVEIGGQLLPREGHTRGYRMGSQGLELGSGKQRPALFSRTIEGLQA
jgi:hypothetical protein